MKITGSEVKEYLRIDNSDEDYLIDSILKASISYCETKLNRPILDLNMNDSNKWEVAEEIRIAVYMLASHWYENRSPIGQVTQEIAFSVSAILAPHRFINV